MSEQVKSQAEKTHNLVPAQGHGLSATHMIAPIRPVQSKSVAVLIV